MNYWKSVSIALAIILSISYAGFAYVYTQGGGIMIAGMVTGGQQPKVITLLKTSNITFLSYLQNWNTSVDILGYKTGFLFCQVFQSGGTDSFGEFNVGVTFETDGIVAGGVYIGRITNTGVTFGEINFGGTRMWVVASTHPGSGLQWAVMSMSLYLRD